MKLNQRGDTIVEVLISVAVISLILSASYALANRSSQATRQAQERSEALKFAESQLENLRSYLASSEDNAWDTDYRCMLDNSTPTADPTQCRRGPDDDIGGRYGMEIIKDGYIYTISSVWTRVGGNGNDSIKISYSIPD